jgi:hypothetical protein
VAQTTTKDGRSVNYIVRVETGTINRAVYRSAVLHDPVVDPPPDPWNRPAGWNGGLLYAYGGGCGTGHHQGIDLGIDSDVLNSPLTGNEPLGLGYAMAAASLNVFGTNCDDVLSAETTMMVKEHFIKQFGVPRTTIGVGASGGSMQVHLISFNYPGLLDGILPERSFPDTVTFEEPYQDCDLLLHAFDQSSLSWTSEQKAAVAGVQNLAFCTANLIWGKLIQPTAVPPLPFPDVFPGCDPSIPEEMRYDPVTNPTGIRCTLYDDMVNVYGRDHHTGFARRTIDNVGVQYGLGALNAGAISWNQFLDLNRNVGGFDIDGNYIPTRTTGDRNAIRIAYQSGRLNSGAQLDRIPIIDVRPYLDATGNVHDDVRSFVMRARLMKANGNADNQVIVTADPTIDIVSFYFAHVLQMDEWLTNIAEDRSHVSVAQKVARNKPPDLVDACYTEPTVKITDPETCQTLYPPSLEARLVAGEPMTDDVIKCSLKPVSLEDYVVPPTVVQFAALQSIFSSGVCDYGRRGVEQRSVIDTWLEFPEPGRFEPVGDGRRADD